MFTNVRLSSSKSESGICAHDNGQGVKMRNESISVSTSQCSQLDTGLADEKSTEEESCEQKRRMSTRTKKLTSKRKFSISDEMEDTEFWSLLSTALTESSGDDDDDNDDYSHDQVDDYDKMTVLHQALDAMEEKPLHAALHKTPQLYSHYEILNSNFQKFQIISLKDSSKNIFRCKACNQNYVCSTALTRHLKTHVCGICNKFFMRKSELLDHKWNHRSEIAAEVAKSDDLPSTYTISKKNRAIIAQYTHRSVKEKKFLCNPCNKNFHHYNVLMRHMVTHICRHCDCFFANRGKLKIHKRNLKEGRLSAISSDLEDHSFAEDLVFERMQATQQIVTCKISPSLETNLINACAPSVTSGHEKSLISPLEVTTAGSRELQLTSSSMNLTNVSASVTLSSDTFISSPLNTLAALRSKSSECHSIQVNESSGSRLDCFILSASSVPNKNARIDASHELFEDRERPFKCRVCGKTFCSRISLRNHKKMHSQLREFVCSSCEKCSRKKHLAEKHQKKSS